MKTIEEYISKFPVEVQEYYRDIIAGKIILSVKRDFVFKMLFDPDRRGNRLSKFLSLVLGFKIKVVGSLKTENLEKTKVSKKIILDILAKTEDGEIIIVEMQIESFEFITQRASVYSSETLVRQYSVVENQRKRDIDYSDLRKVYTVVLMDKSPHEFKIQQDFIHYFSQASKTNPSFRPNFLQEYVVIELKKFLEEKLYETTITELFDWLRFIADDSNKTKQELSKKDIEFLKMYEELIRMSSDRATLFRILEEDLYEFDQKAHYNYAVKMARKEGREEGLEEGLEKGLEKGRLEMLELLRKGYTIEQLEDYYEQ